MELTVSQVRATAGRRHCSEHILARGPAGDSQEAEGGEGSSGKTHPSRAQAMPHLPAVSTQSVLPQQELWGHLVQTLTAAHEQQTLHTGSGVWFLSDTWWSWQGRGWTRATGLGRWPWCRPSLRARVHFRWTEWSPGPRFPHAQAWLGQDLCRSLASWNSPGAEPQSPLAVAESSYL